MSSVSRPFELPGLGMVTRRTHSGACRALDLAAPAEHVIDQGAHALGDLLFDRVDGNAHPLGGFARRKALDLAQPDHLAAARGELVETLLGAAQFLPRVQLALRAEAVEVGFERRHVRDQLDRDDLAALGLVDQMVARDREQIRARVDRDRAARSRQCPFINVLPKIGHVVSDPPIAPNEAGQSAFQGKHFMAEPSIQRCFGLHGVKSIPRQSIPAFPQRDSAAGKSRNISAFAVLGVLWLKPSSGPSGGNGSALGPDAPGTRRPTHRSP